jgi:LysR family glycine cleavage system transcriptional activator
MDTESSLSHSTAHAVPDLPIHELLALEAVSRLGSVQAAADALHVTASGVSHRIASLEKRIGSRLLERRGRGVVLTDVAERYVATVRPGLVELSSSTETLLDREHQLIRIGTAAAVGLAWLLPRIHCYAREHPEVRFELLTVATSDELPQDRWDMLIHYGHPPRRGALRSVLFTEKLVQVCSPELALRMADESSSADAAPPRLADPVPVLRLAQLDVPGRAGQRRSGRSAAHSQLVFDDALAMLEAVAAGAGVALSTETAATPYLAQGRLVRVDEEACEGSRYTIDLSESGQLKPLATACYRWLVQEAAVGVGAAT